MRRPKFSKLIVETVLSSVQECFPTEQVSSLVQDFSVTGRPSVVDQGQIAIDAHWLPSIGAVDFLRFRDGPLLVSTLAIEQLRHIFIENCRTRPVQCGGADYQLVHIRPSRVERRDLAVYMISFGDTTLPHIFSCNDDRESVFVSDEFIRECSRSGLSGLRFEPLEW